MRISCSIAAGRTGYDVFNSGTTFLRDTGTPSRGSQTYEKGVVNMLAKDVDPTGSSYDMGWTRIVRLLELINQSVPPQTTT